MFARDSRRSFRFALSRTLRARSCQLFQPSQIVVLHAPDCSFLTVFAVGALEVLFKKACIPMRNISFLKFPGTPPSQSARVGGVGAASSALVGVESYLTTLGLAVARPVVDIVLLVWRTFARTAVIEQL